MRLARLVVLCAALASAAAGTVEAQRAPVLRQVKVPHPYYYREMLIPQVTSGPGAASWAPSGRELVYAMQGSLWRQAVGSDEARQLTDGPGYDAQPDWSPDGRRIVYASYRDDAVELRLLDLDSGTQSPLVANGAVNIEPRWSRDGRRVAFTSSAHEGRWHVFTVEAVPGGAAPVRITEDRESALPRYYYGKFDQYLSPTWSPDGRELIVVSNRGHTWGSGGFWRIPVSSPGAGREIHDEETTWRAAPDWSPDGRRLAYASYLGRQWHQIWIVPSEGGDPIQLTYGEYDATAPRWSPQGDRLAYVSNEGGNTSLWAVDLPGGRRQRIEAVRRTYLGPVGSLAVVVVDSAGRPLPARISVRNEGDRAFAPDDAWRHADDGFDRAERRFEYGYFHSAGHSELTVPAGTLKVEVSRGPEWRVQTHTVRVEAGRTRTLRVPLRRLANLRAGGWYAGDLHVHMNYGGAYRNDPARLAFQARAEDLHVVENLIVNKEGRIPDIGYFRPGPDPVSDSTTLVLHGQEYHTSFWGHVGLLGLREHLLLPGYTAYAGTAVATLQPSNTAVIDRARAQGALAGYVHPYDLYPDPADTTRALTHALPVDAALGKVDYYEALGFVDDPMATARVWYQLLNCGFRLPAGAGTDAMANFASLRGPVGMNRVYVRSGGPLEHRRWLAALAAGQSFATNGPLLELTVEGRGLGEEIRLGDGGGDVTVRIRLRSNVPVDHLELVRNGAVVHAVPLAGDRTEAEATVRIPVDRSGWLLLRARSDRARYPVLDLYPYATTSPIYLTVGGRPARSRVDAAYFLAWIDRMRQAVEAHRTWNTEDEKRDILKTLARARSEFERRSGEEPSRAGE